MVGASYPKTATLTYTSLANQNGTAVITYHAHDDGGTSPGVDNSADQTFTITVNAVNDPPVVVAPAAFAVQANMKRTGLGGLLGNVNDNADNGVNGCTSTTFHRHERQHQRHESRGWRRFECELECRHV